MKNPLIWILERILDRMLPENPTQEDFYRTANKLANVTAWVIAQAFVTIILAAIVVPAWLFLPPEYTAALVIGIVMGGIAHHLKERQA